MWGHEYVITSLLEIAVKEKNEAAPISWGYPSSYLIHGHASCLPGRSTSSAVHHFGSEIIKHTGERERV